jgi:hypothetical protein
MDFLEILFGKQILEKRKGKKMKERCWASSGPRPWPSSRVLGFTGPWLAGPTHDHNRPTWPVPDRRAECAPAWSPCPVQHGQRGLMRWPVRVGRDQGKSAKKGARGGDPLEERCDVEVALQPGAVVLFSGSGHRWLESACTP